MGITSLYTKNYKEAINDISPETWQRWEANKDNYYKECRKVIDYAVYYYSSRTPMSPEELRGRANYIFCVSCLRWDPNGTASLPTYVARQMLRLSGTDIRIESKHKYESTTAIGPDGMKTDILALIGTPDDNNTLREYVEKAGQDALRLYDACISGWYQRGSKTGGKAPITPKGLFQKRVLGWTHQKRYEEALNGIKKAAAAWRTGRDFKGYTICRKEVPNV